jgi:SpoVK/Ycf46/Vps4 family AAA+-type ATPase
VLNLVQRAIAEYGLKATLCPPGTTDITPVYWRRNRADHFLDVLPDGESARYRVVPKQTDRAPAPYRRVSQEILAQDLRQTTIIEIPRTTIVAPIIGPIATDNRLRVHEIVMYMPGEQRK